MTDIFRSYLLKLHANRYYKTYLSPMWARNCVEYAYFIHEWRKRRQTDFRSRKTQHHWGVYSALLLACSRLRSNTLIVYKFGSENRLLNE